ncbi:MAG: hypothetical protein M9953_13470 [Thermomicrobiales bacterium]|nr:hypothetical protein [Thermomicrobiales bacterium]MCO5229459.1 hypothetical protein [Thermomicrobiales bacterium]
METARAFAHEEYEAFDGARRRDEALAADSADIEKVRRTIEDQQVSD